MAKQTETDAKGPASFCIPRGVVEALLDHRATADEIIAYLILARFTDAEGIHSSASHTAINRYTGANKTREGPIDRALERLATITAKDGRSVLYPRHRWIAETGLSVPDGPTERGKIRYVLPDPDDEEVGSRVWFSAGLVDGFGQFDKPLRALRRGGDAAVRLLLSLYAAADVGTWVGVDPRLGPYRTYKPVASDNLKAGKTLLRSKRGDPFTSAFDSRIGSLEEYWDALNYLEACGFIYEVVMVLDREGKPWRCKHSGKEILKVPDDAEPVFELDARSTHGYRPAGEGWLAAPAARTAGDLGLSVALEGGRFDDTYAAFLPTGQRAMLAGIYRLRFRPANPRSAYVRQAWARIHESNRHEFRELQRLRLAHGKEPLLPPVGAPPNI